MISEYEFNKDGQVVQSTSSKMKTIVDDATSQKLMRGDLMGYNESMTSLEGDGKRKSTVRKGKMPDHQKAPVCGDKACNIF